MFKTIWKDLFLQDPKIEIAIIKERQCMLCCNRVVLTHTSIICALWVCHLGKKNTGVFLYIWFVFFSSTNNVFLAQVLKSSNGRNCVLLSEISSYNNKLSKKLILQLKTTEWFKSTERLFVSCLFGLQNKAENIFNHNWLFLKIFFLNMLFFFLRW